jgi:hypothetical protein
MLKAEQVPEAVWRVAMMTYHREIRRNPEQAWQIAIAAAITTWPTMRDSQHLSFDGRTEYVIILPLTESGDDK